jgi:hypothetical protein
MLRARGPKAIRYGSPGDSVMRRYFEGSLHFAPLAFAM